MNGQENVQREIITLLEELPVNLELKAAFNDEMRKIPSVPGSNQLQYWCNLFEWSTEAVNAQVSESTYYNLILLHNCILHSSLAQQKTSAGSDKDPVTEFVLSFIHRGFFPFLTSFFTSLDKTGLEKSTLKNKTLTMLIEIASQFLSSRWYGCLKDVMTQQIVFDLFNQNLLVFQNFILAVESQQSEFAPDTRLLKNDQ